MAPVGRRITVEHRMPSAPSTTAVVPRTAATPITWESSTPPNRKTTLKTGTEATRSSRANSREATSLPITIDDGRTRVHSRRSSVWRSFSPAMAAAVRTGAMNRTRTSSQTVRARKIVVPTWTLNCPLRTPPDAWRRTMT